MSEIDIKYPINILKIDRIIEGCTTSLINSSLDEKCSIIKNITPMHLATYTSPENILIDDIPHKKIALPFVEQLHESDPRFYSLRTTTDNHGNKYGRMYAYVEIEQDGY